VTSATLAASAGLFDIEESANTIIITPLLDLREFDYERIETAACDILEALNKPGTKNVVLDFQNTDYYGSTALGFFLRIWKRVSLRGGRMAFCNVSEHEKEILQITHLDRLWPICTSRNAAMEAVKV
jgi:stage II sporulation protein AA (anti-sigma F factor antagonist)